MKMARTCLFNILCLVIAILILITYGFRMSFIDYTYTIGINYTELNAQQTTTNLSVRYIRHRYPQIWACQSANFEGKSGYYSQLGEDEALHKWIFNNTKQNQNPGIFVEIGAFNGITFSNTLFFERMFDWRGVLIEAQPDSAKQLLRSNRTNTVKLPFGICSPPQTHIRILGGADLIAGNIDTMEESFRKIWHKDNNKTYNVPCGRIGSFLSAIGITHIDLFSLDVEGGELSVLLTMDWNIQVHYLLVENNSKTPNVTELLKYHGFRVHSLNPTYLKIVGNPFNTLYVNDNYKRPNFSLICLPDIRPSIS